MKPLSEREMGYVKEGYVPVRLAADKTQRHPTTIQRLMRDGVLKFKQDGQQRFVSVNSLIDYLGPEAAKRYGLTRFKEPASGAART